LGACPHGEPWLFFFIERLSLFYSGGRAEHVDRKQKMSLESTRRAAPNNSFGIKLAGLIVRSVFILLLAALTVKVASPQIETLSTLGDTPSDLVRVVLGLAVCIWCIVNLFILPKGVEAYRIWVYLGFAVLPLSLLCAIVVW
jgi:hypothetical protein